MSLPKKDRIKELVFNNKKIIENYFFMTVLQALNSLFYLLISRYLMRVLGLEVHGIYVLALSIVTICITIVNFGLDMLGVRSISENKNDDKVKKETLSIIFTTNIYLEFIISIIYFTLVFTIPQFKSYWIVFAITFSQSLTSIFFPTWFFQGIQKMRVVTFIQLAFKLISLPFILLLVRIPSDLWIYALIVSCSSVLGGFTAFFIIRYHYKIKIKWMPFSCIKKWVKDAFPFFLSNSTGIVKQESVKLFAGFFAGTGYASIYDLANKIIMVPRTLSVSMNGAIFPKLIENIRNDIVKKIIKIETFVGLVAILLIVIFGKYAVLILGAGKAPEAYLVAIILSVTILTWLVVGAFIYFVFIPNNKYYFVTKNQFVAFISYFIFIVIGLFFSQSIYIMAAALTFSGIVEIVYCIYLIKKYKLL